jgi:hypothetical protein
MRARTVWLIALPFLLVSEIVGHALVARLFDADNPRHRLLAHAVADYRAYAQAAVALALVLVVAGLVRRSLASFRGEGPRRLPGWPLATIPAATFLVQEHVERLLHDGEFGWLVSAEPAVLAGVVLQLPCGLFALWLVRALLQRADGIGLALARRSAPRIRLALQSRRLPFQPTALRPAALASRQAGRAPPLAG